MFLSEDRLRSCGQTVSTLTVYGALNPILRGIGDIANPHVEMLSNNLG
jgi:hypothetical protein